MKKLLKVQSYVEFVHMTNVLPITKYSSGSELNMLVEHDMATSENSANILDFPMRMLTGYMKFIRGKQPSPNSSARNFVSGITVSIALPEYSSTIHALWFLH